jgi:glycosyltransferase involved in cell wall biosynthesis
MKNLSMSEQPLVSILTPVFNLRSYIRETIRSVLNQTYRNWEWIILDDGSTDGTGDIIKKYKDSRIRYTFQEHAGVKHLTETFNKALSMCNGELVAMLDGDDYWPGYKLEAQIKGFNDPEVVLSYGESCVVNQNGKKIKYVNLPKDPSIASNNPVGSALKKFILERSCFLINSTVMLKKNILLNIGGFVDGEGPIQDFPTWIKLSLEGKFSAIPVCLGYYRKHPSSLTMRENSEHLFDYSINFLSEFIIQNVEKLHEFGFFFDLERLEEHWGKMKTYLPYNNAMYMLMIGSFKKAKAEFKKFLENYPSIKHKLIYYLIILSALLKFDLVNPVASLKGKIYKA